MSSTYKAAKAAWHLRWDRWLEKRIPASTMKTLGHRDVFVFPSAWGLIFCALILLVLITGINYENAMVMASGFFMAALLVLHIVQSYKNLAGLRFSFKGAESCFAGESVSFEFEVHACGRSRAGLDAGWLPESYVRFDIESDEPLRLHIPRNAGKRGRFRPGRLLITTAWPFGLVRVWTWQDLNADCWVYPAPVLAAHKGSSLMQESDDEGPTRNQHQQDSFDFAGLRQYVEGEPMTRIAWKKMAQTGQMLVREFSEQPVLPAWVDFNAYAGVELETRLSLMCGHLCSLFELGMPFGLLLPDQRFEPACTETHKHACLLALARFGVPE